MDVGEVVAWAWGSVGVSRLSLSLASNDGTTCGERSGACEVWGVGCVMCVGCWICGVCEMCGVRAI